MSDMSAGAQSRMESARNKTTGRFGEQQRGEGPGLDMASTGAGPRQDEVYRTQAAAVGAHVARMHPGPSLHDPNQCYGCGGSYGDGIRGITTHLSYEAAEELYVRVGDPGDGERLSRLDHSNLAEAHCATVATMRGQRCRCGEDLPAGHNEWSTHFATRVAEAAEAKIAEKRRPRAPAEAHAIEVARAHPNHTYDTVEQSHSCKGCGAVIERLDGSVEAGWAQHVASEASKTPAAVHSGEVYTTWSCLGCNEEATVPLAELPEVGTPICPDCGDDMSLGDTVKIGG